MSAEDDEQWAEVDDENGSNVEETQLMAPRILAGQEDRRHWQTESMSGMMATTAEGIRGKKLQRIAMMTRDDKQRLIGNMEKIAKDANIPNDILASVSNYVKIEPPIIPDIRYKSPAGMLLGYMAKDFIGKKLGLAERKEFDKILEKVRDLKNKELRISDLDCVRYARGWKIWLREFGVWQRAL